MVQRLAGAADDPGELVAHATQPGHPCVDLVDLLGEPRSQRLGRERPAPPHDAEVVLDFRQREAERLGVLDGTEETDRVLVVAPVPARRAGRLGQQAAALVVPQVSTLTPARRAASPALT